MPRRDDLETIAIIGSGPIVIGQACEFDYSGVAGAQGAARGGLPHRPRQLEPGDDHDRPGLGRRDLPRAARPGRRDAACCGASAPTRCCPTLGGQTALNLAMELEPGGRARRARDRADRRLGEGHPHGRGPRGVRRGDGLGRPARAALGDRPHDARRRAPRCGSDLQLPVVIRPAFTLGGHGGGFAATPSELRRGRRPRPAREPDRPGAGRGVGRGLGRVRARGDPRQARQRRDRLLDREPRPDGRAHRRLGLRGAGDDAVGPRVPGAARRRRRGDPRGRRRDRRLQRPVRAQPRDRRGRRDRDEPARLALLGAGLEGHGLPDRQGRHASSPSATRSTRSRTTSPARRRPRSSRPSTTWSSRRRASRSRSSPAPTRR